MFGLSFTHLFILAVIAIVFIGPEQLPEVARTFARLLNEWKRATGEIQGSLARTLQEEPKPQPPPPPTELPPHAPNSHAGANPSELAANPEHLPIDAETAEKKS